MHGRLKVKTTKEQEEELKIKEREKAFHFLHLTDRLFDLRHSIKEAEDHIEYFKISTELLLINPDFYTVWNIRREVLLTHVERHQNEVETIWKDELAFTIDCLKKNEKSYSVWQHRIWILSNMPKSEYDAEILLCNSFLAKDERNFHCWDYRSYICDLAKADIEKELAFTTEKIRTNFSNFSAWHRRHKLLLKAMSLQQDECPDSCNLKLIWQSEYDMVLNAIFTDPNDHSPRLYHNWLVKNHLGNLSQDQLDKLLMLGELEPGNARVKQMIDTVKEYLN